MKSAHLFLAMFYILSRLSLFQDFLFLCAFLGLSSTSIIALSIMMSICTPSQ